MEEFVPETGHTVESTALECVGMNRKAKMSTGEEKETEGQVC